MFKKMKQKMLNNVQQKIEKQVELHDNWLIDKILHRIEILSCDNNTNYDWDYIVQDIKNRGYLLEDSQRSVLNDKEKCNESN